LGFSDWRCLIGAKKLSNFPKQHTTQILGNNNDMTLTTSF